MYFFSSKHIILGFGLLFTILATFITLFWNDILEQKVKDELILSNTSKAYDIFMKNPFPLYVNFYFFNWTNPSNLRLPGYKPQFQEVGPYRFREEVNIVELKWNQNGTVTYKKLRKWFFVPEDSNGSLDDVITTLNVVALTAARSTKNWNKMVRMPLSMTLSATQKVNIRKKVREFLFEGFSDPLIEFASNIPGLSSHVPFDKFGWFYKRWYQIKQVTTLFCNSVASWLQSNFLKFLRIFMVLAGYLPCCWCPLVRNGTAGYDGVFNMETGANGLNFMGKLRFWNYLNHTSYESYCGNILGSAGTFWPPKRVKTDDVFLYSPDMCRSISFKYRNDENFAGLNSYRYDSGPELFDNGTINEESKCFCNEKCYPVGVIDVSRCKFGAPAFVSYPHFHLADSFYLKSISGMEPDHQKHDMYIILEKTWSIPLEIAIRLQINILVESDPGIRMFTGLPTIFFPMIWFEQKVTMPEYMRSDIKILLALPAVGLTVSIFFYAVGSVCIVVYALIILKKKREMNSRFVIFRKPTMQGFLEAIQ